jgi:hypothetical protein
MLADRALTDAQAMGDYLVRRASRDLAEDLNLSRRQPGVAIVSL